MALPVRGAAAGKAPSERLDIVSKVVSAKAGSDRNVCAAPAFGVEVDPSITEINARQLPSMKLTYRADAGLRTERKQQVNVGQKGD